jgi:alpha/beta superfamily hydrolase
MSIHREAVTFASLDASGVTLVGDLALPSAATGRWPGVVLCHPQPLVADMNDPLIVTLARDLVEAGMAALRFNFRGVAPSQGTSTDGRLEPLDVGGAVAWLAARPDVDSRRLALVGHAFGAIAVLAYAGVDPQIGTVVVVSPPHFRLVPGLADRLTTPKLAVIAEHDEVSPRYKIEPWIAKLPGQRGLSVIAGAEHLMRGHEAQASGIIVSYLTRWAQGAGA